MNYTRKRLRAHAWQPPVPLDSGLLVHVNINPWLLCRLLEVVNSAECYHQKYCQEHHCNNALGLMLKPWALG